MLIRQIVLTLEHRVIQLPTKLINVPPRPGKIVRKLAGKIPMLIGANFSCFAIDSHFNAGPFEWPGVESIHCLFQISAPAMMRLCIANFMLFKSMPRYD
jgi:hypothetical protein